MFSISMPDNKLTLVVAPPQQSQEEIRALEADAAFTVQGAITTAVLLYLCTSGQFLCSL